MLIPPGCQAVMIKYQQRPRDRPSRFRSPADASARAGPSRAPRRRGALLRTARPPPAAAAPPLRRSRWRRPRARRRSCCGASCASRGKHGAREGTRECSAADGTRVRVGREGWGLPGGMACAYSICESALEKPAHDGRIGRIDADGAQQESPLGGALLKGLVVVRLPGAEEPLEGDRRRALRPCPAHVAKRRAEAGGLRLQ